LEHQIRIPTSDVQWIELDAAYAPDVLKDTRFLGQAVRRPKPMMGEHESPGLSFRDRQRFHWRY
jgi:hypothetical protein